MNTESTFENVINAVSDATFTWAVIAIIGIIIQIALIIAVFNISKRATRQDQGQDIIINILKEIRDNQNEILEEMRYNNYTQDYEEDFYNNEPPFD